METYNINSNFKSYVDRYCVKHKKTVEEALQDRIVCEVEKQYIKNVSRVAGYSDYFMGKFTEVK